MAVKINKDFEGREVIFLGILNGSFMFAADLFRKINLRARISFLKLASYHGTSSSGDIKELIGWNEDLKHKSIIIIEDIVDTGCTLEHTVNNLIIRKVTDIKIAALFLKTDVYRRNIPIDYVGFDTQQVVVGCLDYNGFGRNFQLFILSGLINLFIMVNFFILAWIRQGNAVGQTCREIQSDASVNRRHAPG
jgi:hypoxanthine phosphoribosyltransferase